MKMVKNIAPVVLALFLGLSAPVQAAEDARSLVEAGKVAEALDLARTEAEAAPGDLERQELYIDILLSFGLGPRAERLYRERVRTTPEDADAWYLVGRSAVGRASAREAYEAALRLKPTHARSHMGMAAVHVASGRLDHAAAAYAQALKGDDSLSEAWLGLIRTLAGEGQEAAALEAAQHALKAVPDEAGVYLALATLAPTQARAVLTSGAARVSGDARLHARLAEELLAAGEGPQALNSASKAVQLDRGLPEALRAKLFAEEMVKDRIDASGYAGVRAAHALPPTESLAAWGELVTAHPRSALVRAGRARARELDGNQASAGADLEAALRLDPKNVEVQAALGLLRLRSGFPVEATPLLAKAWEARRWDVSLGLALADALTGSGQIAAGQEMLRGLAETQPFDLRVGQRYAQALLDAGDHEQAYTFARKRLKRVPDPQLGVALVAAALATGRTAEAAAIIEDIARQTDNAALMEAARRLRGG